jgi:hypothetical protein
MPSTTSPIFTVGQIIKWTTRGRDRGCNYPKTGTVVAVVEPGQLPCKVYPACLGDTVSCEFNPYVDRQEVSYIVEVRRFTNEKPRLYRPLKKNLEKEESR